MLETFVVDSWLEHSSAPRVTNADRLLQDKVSSISLGDDQGHSFYCRRQRSLRKAVRADRPIDAAITAPFLRVPRRRHHAPPVWGIALLEFAPL